MGSTTCEVAYNMITDLKTIHNFEDKKVADNRTVKRAGERDNR